MEELYIEGYKNHKLCLNIYDNVTSPLGVVQIIHGMQEHQGRYRDFAEFLNKNGYIVYSSDLRGHGKTRKKDMPWGYSENDISIEILHDQAIISKIIKDRYPDLKLYLFAHSYGSFIAQMYLMKYEFAEKIILSGSTYTKSSLFRFAKFVTNIAVKFFGKDKDAEFVENLSLKAYEKGFKDGNWLTRDEKNFEKYKADIYCGHSFRLNFYHSLFNLFSKNYNKINNVNKSLPILILSGDEDPVGNKGKGVKKLYNFYKNHKLNVKMKLYKGARHEILKETNREEVYKDILDFLKS